MSLAQQSLLSGTGKIRGLRGHHWLVVACETKLLMHNPGTADDDAITPVTRTVICCSVTQARSGGCMSMAGNSLDSQQAAPT